MTDGGHGGRDDHIDQCGICAMEVDDPIYHFLRLRFFGCIVIAHWMGRCTVHLMVDPVECRKTLLKEQGSLD